MATLTPRQLTDLIRAAARDIGADAVGFAPAELPPEAEPAGVSAYDAWLASGMHGTMGYMARDPERRHSISRWFPPAKSVVLLGFGYAPPPGTPESLSPHLHPLPYLAHDIAPSAVREDVHLFAQQGERKIANEIDGRIARYALSPDYHDTLRKKLDVFLERIRNVLPDIQAKSFVDSSPILERLYGRYAGIGWIGKNTMLLSQRIGSFFFLCGLALDRELVYDEPTPDHCGSCNRCLTACPTDAFPQARVLDASRCISYFTIEHRGAVPEAFREGIGNWVFGCDICQDVCPWNRFSVQNPAFWPKIPNALPLEYLANLPEQEFERALGNTPMERARWKGLVRNALLAMGNSKNREFLPALERFATHSDPVVSEQARWSLSRLAEQTAVPANT